MAQWVTSPGRARTGHHTRVAQKRGGCWEGDRESSGQGGGRSLEEGVRRVQGWGSRAGGRRQEPHRRGYGCWGAVSMTRRDVLRHRGLQSRGAGPGLGISGRNAVSWGLQRRPSHWRGPPAWGRLVGEEAARVRVSQGSAPWEALAFLCLEPPGETPRPEHIPPLPIAVLTGRQAVPTAPRGVQPRAGRLA